MSAELIAIIAAAISIGGLVSIQIAGLRSAIASLDARVRAVETELAYLRGLIEGRGIAPPAAPPAADGDGTAV